MSGRPVVVRLALGASIVCVSAMATMSLFTPAAGSGKPSQDMIERGKYLVTVGGCNDCHSPHDQTGKVMPGRELSGHPDGAPLPEWDPSLMKRNILATINPPFTAFAGPFGTAIASNLTPDKETGIGDLTAEALIKSWRSGRHWKYDRMVFPPMPIESLGKLTDEDIRAIHAYLMSLPPVKNHVRSSFSMAGAPKG